jgi:hypothetical protein
MDTFADIIAQGNAANETGAPFVSNWPQMRGAICMLGRAGGGLDRMRISDFKVRFPTDFQALDPATQAALPGEKVYYASRYQVSRMLAALGEIDDPWEQLRMLIRREGRAHDIENAWYSLRSLALDAGLAPSDIRTHWVWSLEAETVGGARRQSLRRSVTAFNKLFYIEAIADSGLLPPSPIGPPPAYDRQGRRVYQLPPTLARHHVSAPQLQQVWQAICVSGAFVDLPDDPSANDLLTPGTWRRIKQLPQSITGVRESSWSQYLQCTRRVLLPHATIPVPEHLPRRLEVMIESERDHVSIAKLWGLMYAQDLTDAEPDELLQLATWREMWRKVPQQTAASSWRQCEARARTLVVRHATHMGDPYRVVTRTWADLPKHLKTALDPIRKHAERALLRPLDLTPEWVAARDLDPSQEAQVTDALREVFFAAAQIQRTAERDPVTVAWEALRAAVRSQDYSPRKLSAVIRPATRDGVLPSDITREWALNTAKTMTRARRAKYAAALRDLDRWRDNPALAPLLPAEAIGSLPDARKGGKREPPKEMLQEVANLHDAYERAASTRNEGRAVLRKLWTAAVASGVEARNMRSLLSAADTLDIDARTRRKAGRLLHDLDGLLTF